MQLTNAADAVTAAELAANAVGVAEIQALGVGAAEIQVDAVGASKIVAAGVGSAELQSGAVTGGKLASNFVKSSGALKIDATAAFVLRGTDEAGAANDYQLQIQGGMLTITGIDEVSETAAANGAAGSGVGAAGAS